MPLGLNLNVGSFVGRTGSAPAPFDLFLASIGTCAGIYVYGYCRNHGLPTEGLYAKDVEAVMNEGAASARALHCRSRRTSGAGSECGFHPP